MDASELGGAESDPQLFQEMGASELGVEEPDPQVADQDRQTEHTPQIKQIGLDTYRSTAAVSLASPMANSISIEKTGIQSLSLPNIQRSSTVDHARIHASNTTLERKLNGPPITTEIKPSNQSLGQTHNSNVVESKLQVTEAKQPRVLPSSPSKSVIVNPQKYFVNKENKPNILLKSTTQKPMLGAAKKFVKKARLLQETQTASHKQTVVQKSKSLTPYEISSLLSKGNLTTQVIVHKDKTKDVPLNDSVNSFQDSFHKYAHHNGAVRKDVEHKVSVKKEDIAPREPCIPTPIFKQDPAKYIGDMDRMFATFEDLESSKSVPDHRVQKFLDSLDVWGLSADVPPPLFNWDLGPSDWIDREVAEDLDRMALTERVFMYNWLPKCSLKMRVDPYRSMLRSINKKDPNFNVVW